MAYVECKVWHFQGDDDKNLKSRHEAMKAGCRHYTVKALINTASSVNFISKSLADKLGRRYGKHYKNKRVKNSLGTIDCLDISFRYKEEDRLVSGSDEALSDFEVVTKPGKVDLILGIPWLWIHEAKIDMWKEGITIYNNFVPFCKHPKNNEYYDSETDDSSSSESDSTKLKRKVKKLERTVDWIGNYVEDQTGLEPGKEISSDSDYAPCEASISLKEKAKPRRNPTRAVRSN